MSKPQKIVWTFYLLLIVYFFLKAVGGLIDDSNVFIAYRYYQSRSLQKTANTLATQNKYNDALKKYEESQKVWNSEDTNIKIQDTKEALENYGYYQNGSKFIN